ncbi:Kae1-associated serine/threonine protein kinase [Candidatus Woesearchaeota archaeon]|nr:Kae1-associated serine/threonine protein kinase [Candidatus Woesearchaeota archaeon]
MEIIGRGAEAVIRKKKQDGAEIAVKERIKKSYRIDEIDQELRKLRTRKEAKVLETINQVIPSPKLLKVGEKENLIEMEFIAGEKIRDVLEKEDYIALCKQIGMQVAKIHKKNLIHGDLTTSNFILKEGKIYFIDFGLSFHSARIEDKAVDLHLLKQALESKHYTIWKECFEAAINGYTIESDEADDVLKRLEQVEKRGRYKEKS